MPYANRQAAAVAMSEEEFSNLFGQALIDWGKAKYNSGGWEQSMARGYIDDPHALGRDLRAAWKEYSANPQQWLSRVQTLDPDKNSFGQVFNQGYGDAFWDRALAQVKSGDPNAAAADAQAASRASASESLKAFAAHMMAPLDLNDPYVKQVIQGATSAAQNSANLRGVGGGYATSNVENAALRTGNQIQDQRAQMGMQALGQAGQLDQAQATLAQQAYMQQYQSQLAQMQAHQNNNQALGSLIGAGVGALGSYFGVPGLNMQSGAQFGGGIGGMAGGGAQVPVYTPPALGTQPVPGPSYSTGQYAYRPNSPWGTSGGGLV